MNIDLEVIIAGVIVGGGGGVFIAAVIACNATNSL